MANTLRIDQAREYPITTVLGDRISFRFAFDRSADSIRVNEPGQDDLAINYDHRHIAFVLCDGVSQSFYGNLASNLLARKLVDWLWEGCNSIDIFQQSQFEDDLTSFLQNLTGEASQIIQQYPLPDILAPMLRTVLEKKRALGSETTFAAGFVNMEADFMFLCWMGDSRVRIWDQNEEISSKVFGENSFQTRERWSTHRGLIGKLHTYISPASHLKRILTYSDGLSRLDTKISFNSPSDHTLEMLIHESKLLPSSDDISLLEIWPGNAQKINQFIAKPPSMLRVNIDQDKQLISAKWRSPSQADQYEVAIQSSRGWKIFPVDKQCWEKEVSSLPSQFSCISVRNWVYGEASAWVHSSKIDLPEVEEATLQANPVNLPQGSFVISPDQSTTPQTKTQLLRPKSKWQRRLYFGGLAICILLLLSFIWIFQSSTPPPEIKSISKSPYLIKYRSPNTVIPITTTMEIEVTVTPACTPTIIPSEEVEIYP